MTKIKYVQPQLELLEFTSDDVITQSNYEGWNTGSGGSSKEDYEGWIANPSGDSTNKYW